MTFDASEKLLSETRTAGILRIVVGAVLKRDEKALLLQRRKDDYLGGIFEIPSGEVEEGETLRRALERKTKEETGLSVIRVDEYLGSFEYSSRSGQKSRQLNFRVSVRPSAFVLTEHEAFVWVNKADVEDYPVSNQTRELVRQAL